MTVSFRLVLIVFFLIMIPFALGEMFGWFIVYPWLDIPFHLAGGLWVSLLFFFLFGNLFSNEFYSHRFEKVKVLIFAVCFAVFIGVLWEFGEFLLDQWFNFYLQQGVADTMKDLLNDIIGGLVGGSYILFFRKHK